MLDDSEFQDVKAWLEESDKDRTQATQVDMPFTGPARKEADCKQKLSNEFIILKNEYTRKSDECDQLRRFQAQPHIEKTQAANDERELSDIPDVCIHEYKLHGILMLNSRRLYKTAITLSWSLLMAMGTRHIAFSLLTN